MVKCTRETADFWDCFISIFNGEETVIYPCGCVSENGEFVKICLAREIAYFKSLHESESS